MKIVYDDVRAYQQLINAVIARAMLDCFRLPSNNQIDSVTFSAFEFLFGKDVDPWLELIDIDPTTFKNRMKNSMWDIKISPSSTITEAQKRSFRQNYKLWSKKRNEFLLLDIELPDDDE